MIKKLFNYIKSILSIKTNSSKIIFFTKFIFKRNTILKLPQNSLKITDSIPYKSKFIIEGNNNSIDISGHHENLDISILGTNNLLEINKSTQSKGLRIVIKGNYCHITIKEYTCFGNGCWIVCMGYKNNITINDDCMIADNVNIWATDSHPIYDLSDLSIPINKSQPIILKKHVWVGKNSTILKGIEIGNDSIIGMNSTVTHNIPSCSIYAGNPAKLIKNNITWNRKHISI